MIGELEGSRKWKQGWPYEWQLPRRVFGYRHGLIERGI